MNKSSTNSMKDNIMRVPDDHRNKNHSEETRMNKSSTNSMNDNIMRVPDDLRNNNPAEEK